MYLHVCIYVLCSIYMYMYGIVGAVTWCSFYFISLTVACGIFSNSSGEPKTGILEWSCQSCTLFSLDILWLVVRVILWIALLGLQGTEFVVKLLFWCSYTQVCIFPFLLLVFSSAQPSATHFLLLSSFCNQSYFPQTYKPGMQNFNIMKSLLQRTQTSDFFQELLELLKNACIRLGLFVFTCNYM